MVTGDSLLVIGGGAVRPRPPMGRRVREVIEDSRLLGRRPRVGKRTQAFETGGPSRTALPPITNY